MNANPLLFTIINRHITFCVFIIHEAFAIRRDASGMRWKQTFTQRLPPPKMHLASGFVILHELARRNAFYWCNSHQRGE